MKRLIVVILICTLALCLASCAEKKYIEDGKEVLYINGFKVIKVFNDYPGCVEIRLVCDPETKVVYYMAGSTDCNAFALTPYYITKNGKAEIAIYGRNYFD